MPQQRYLSTITINGNDLLIKDAELTSAVNEIVAAISANNIDISERINNLNDRSFDSLIEISSDTEIEISNIKDGMYKINYVSIIGEDENTQKVLDNTGILIQQNTNQYLYKDGNTLKRTKENNIWGNWIIYDISNTYTKTEIEQLLINERAAHKCSNWLLF